MPKSFTSPLDRARVTNNIEDRVKILESKMKQVQSTNIQFATIDAAAQDLGVFQVGNFQAGTGSIEGGDLTGSAMVWPGVTIGGVTYTIFGMNNGVLEFGLSAIDGTAIAGGGSVFLDRFGINFKNQLGSANFQDLTTGSYDKVEIYIDGADVLTFVNQVGSKGIDFLMDDSAHNVAEISFGTFLGNNTAIELLDNTAGGAGSFIFIGSSISLWSGVAGNETVFNDTGIDMDFRIEGDTDTNLFKVDASTDRIGIGKATPGYKFDVNGDINLSSTFVYRINGVAVMSSTSVGITAEANANDIYRVNSASTSDFVATINGTPSGTSVVYNAPSSGSDNTIVPASTSQLGKLVLYNTTRGTNALISNVNTGTKTITLTATVPAGWVNTDTITTRSQTNTDVSGSAHFYDVKITSGITGAQGVSIFGAFSDTAGAGQVVSLHPFATFAAGKNQFLGLIGNTQQQFSYIVPIITDTFTVRWSASGAGTATLILRESSRIG